MPQFYEFQEFRPTRMMSLSQIKEISEVHEIGAHSYTHASMAHETDEYLTEDVLKCKSYFRKKLDQDIDIYAFPNGSCKPNQPEILKAAGINHVLLVGDQFCFKDKDDDLIHRFNFDATGGDELRYRATVAKRVSDNEGNCNHRRCA